MKTTIAIAMTTFMLGVFPSRVRASLIEIAITAEITYVDDSGNLLGGNVNVGDMIYGQYIYDSEATDSEPFVPYHGSYNFFQPPNGIALEINNLHFITDPSNMDFHIGVINNQPGACDAYTVISKNNLPLFDNIPVSLISWSLQDYSMSALSDIDLPATAPVLSDWQDVNLLMITGGGNPQEGESAFGFIAPVRSAALIPEPATLILLSLGMLRLGRKRRFVLPDVGGH
ncbi:MAG: PEP-CTERM sorting domain-containing protein [Sedimentisphaerales bacterium]|nr:PEP-CTERM sorting domain-containing protein [Sedimentisphaerales bacterium]